MLPTIAEFDEGLAQVDGVLARAEAAQRRFRDVQELLERAGRARSLALLDLYEHLAGQGRRNRYHEIAMLSGLSLSRVQQLLADARIWRAVEATERA